MALSSASAFRKDKKVSSVSLEHRHFAFIASVINSMSKVHNQEQGFIDIREDVAEEFSNKLAATNPNFNRERFIKACLESE